MAEVNSSWPKKERWLFLKGNVVMIICRTLIKLLFGQVPRDPEDPQGAERQKEAQRLIDEAEPLNEEEVTEKEQLLQEVLLV